MDAEHFSQLHHLPVTDLEAQLKRCKRMRESDHTRVLTPEEMSEYMTWMAREFGGRPDYGFRPDDIPATTGGSMADIHAHFRKNRRDPQTVAEMKDIIKRPGEAHFFSERQSISASRFLRHLPAYWQSSEFFEVYYVFSGQCPVWFTGEKVILSSGDLLLIPPQIKHAYCCPEDNSVMFYIMIRSSTFSRVFWDQLSSQNLMSLFFRQALAGNCRTDYLRFDTGSDEAVERLFYAVYREYQSDSAYSSQMTNSLLSTFFIYLLQHYERTARVSPHGGFHWKPEFAEIFSYIQENYRRASLSELASQAGYSSRQIIRIIQGSTGKTFTQLVTQLRMEKATDLLAARELSVEQVSEAVGYSSLSSFYRVFAEWYGCTPAKWRETM